MDRSDTISYREFAQQVRRFPRTQLLSACALVSSHQIAAPNNQEKEFAIPPFAVAGVARAAAIWANDNRPDQRIEEITIRRLCKAFIDVHDPFIDDMQLEAFFCRMANEQLTLQGALFNDVARTQALLVDAAAEYGSTLITESFWRSVIGCTTHELFAVALMLHASAIANRGRFDPTWLEQPNFDPIHKIIPKSTILDVFRKQFSATPKVLRELASIDQPQGNLERYAFNPLRTRPIVDCGNGPHVAPVAQLLMLRAGPGVLYYDAIKEGGRQFTSELGHVFQFYVGKQLRLTQGKVYDEVVFDGQSGQQRSVDFIVELPEAVLLVECKAIPMRADGRRGQSQMHDDIAKTPGKAADQIDATVALIHSNHPAFAFVPRDRPLVGIIVTLDPYYVMSVRKPLVDTWLASIRDLEQLVTITSSSFGSFLLKRPTGIHVPMVSTNLRDAKLGRNVILDDAWVKLPFNPNNFPEV